MSIEKSYKLWSEQYDDDVNKTRDLEGKALIKTLSDLEFQSCLELGCGTGKNTNWLLNKASEIVAVDLTEEMLSKACAKIQSPKVTFILSDIRKKWNFTDRQFDIVIFSLVLEHIKNLGDIFHKASIHIVPNGFLYIGELHPLMQHIGSKAGFINSDRKHTLTCYTHNLSEYTRYTKVFGCQLIDIDEYFDGDNTKGIPRILTLLFQKVKTDKQDLR